MAVGMRVGSSGAAAGMQSSAVSNWQQRQQSFNDLNTALQSRDLASRGGHHSIQQSNAAPTTPTVLSTLGSQVNTTG